MAVSWDGTAAAAVFKKSEIGEVISAEEKAKTFQKFYGHKIAMKSSELVQNLDAFLAMKNDTNKKPESTKQEPPQPVKRSPDRPVPESESQDLVSRSHR
jgi:hypothetical protein